MNRLFARLFAHVVGAMHVVVLIALAALLVATFIDHPLAETARTSSASSAEREIRALQRAVTIQPRQDHAFAFLGDAYLRHASELRNPTEGEEARTRAEEALRTARDLNPLSPEHTLRLGDLHAIWAGRASGRDVAEDHHRRSLDYYEQAARLAPGLLPVADRLAKARRRYTDFLAARPGNPVDLPPRPAPR